MLLSLFSLTCLLAVHLAKAGLGGQACNKKISQLVNPPDVSESNYAVDLFAGVVPFAYAIDQCTATDTIGGFAKFTCKDNGRGAIKTVYTDSECTTAAFQTRVEEFYCTGNNNYGMVNIAVDDSTCKSGVTVYAGLGACVDFYLLNFRVYCNATEALVEIYLPYDIPTNPPPTPTTGMPFGSSSDMPETSSTPMSTSSTPMSTSSTPMSTSSTPMESSLWMSSGMEETSSSTPFQSTTSTWPALQTTSTSFKLCDEKFICNRWTFSNDNKCTLVGALATPGSTTVHKVFAGGESSCYVSGTTAGKKSASSLVAIINLVVAFAVALFSLL